MIRPSKNTPHLVLVSGLMCNATFWAEQIGVLSESNRIACPNLANFNRFDKMAKFIFQ